MAVNLSRGVAADVVRRNLRMLNAKATRSVMKRVSEWIIFPAPGGLVHVYLRMNIRRGTLTIANIQSETPGAGDGTFIREHIEMFATRNCYRTVIVENVNNHRYQEHLICKGYKIRAGTGLHLADNSVIVGATVFMDMAQGHE